MDTAAVQAVELKLLSLGGEELETLRPVLTRMARVAKAMFNAAFADVVLFDGDRIWRAGRAKKSRARTDPASKLCRVGNEVMWVENLLTDPRFGRHSSVRNNDGLRAYAGAPVILSSGEHVGVLAIYSDRIMPRDETLAARLQDLAEVVGFECDRVIATKERERLVEKMRRTEHRLDVAVKSAGLYVYEIDHIEGVLIKAGLEQDFYQKPRTYEDVRDDLSGVVHPDDLESVNDAWRRHFRTGEPVRAEWRINRPDKLVWVASTGEMYRDENKKTVRMIGVMQDITARKESELEMAEAKSAAEAANVAKSAFLATMSHEIRTPLNGVLGMAQAMAADELDPVQRDRLSVIRESGESLLAILNDILDLSKIEAGRLELEEIDFDLAEIARGAHATFTALANKKGLSFMLDIEDARGVYRGDPTRVRQVLYNLISNALKFTEDGEIRVKAVHERAGLTISVTDTGIGMSSAVQKALFAKFNQADATTTRKFGGTGLGLSICKQLAECMGGEIVVKSAEGVGSTFIVTLPIPRIGEARAAVPVVALEETAEASPLEIRVLAAEDNSVNQLVLRTLLHQIGVDPVVVENGKLAVEAWETGDWDVILMDVQMPVMDGPSAVRAIRAREAATSRPRTPIIALTANAMAHQVAEYAACGMDGHVTKPIEAMKLFAALEEALDLAEAARAAA